MNSKKPYDQYTKDEIDKYRHQFVKSTLRKASYRWPWRTAALQRARVAWGVYKCEICKKEIEAKEKQLDHTEPVVDVKKGFKGWDSYCERLFTDSSGFQVLCFDCHATKTKEENSIRRKRKKK